MLRYDVRCRLKWPGSPVLKYIYKRWYPNSLQDRWGYTGTMGASGLKLIKYFVPGQ